MNNDIKEELHMLQKNIGTYVNDVKELKETSEKNQAVIDNMLGQRSVNTLGQTDTSLEGQIASGLQDNQDNFVKFVRKEVKSFSFELKDTLLSTGYTGGTAYTNSAGRAIIPTANPRHVRDLFIQTTMTGSSLPVLKDNGQTGAVAAVAEGANKPLLDFSLAEQTAKAEVLAGVVVVSRQFLDDLPSATQFLVGRLAEAYATVEDSQLLNGDGISPNLKGINTAGNFTAATSLAAANDVTQLVSGIIQLRAMNRNATGIVLHPTNYASILLNVASGSGEFDLPSYVSVNGTGGISILGIPVIDTTQQTVGRYNIIDKSGMLVAIRQNTTIEFFEQDSTNIRQNKVSVRVEGRIAFPVYSSNYVIQGTF